METATEFMKLEKIELGGIKGKLLSQQVVQLFEEFNALYQTFTSRSYDALDPSDPVSISFHSNAEFAFPFLYGFMTFLQCSF